MRITAAEKEQTRQRITAAAVRQFREAGFAAATTRDIARDARIATGTLFNYFTSKEDIVLALAVDALATAADDFARSRPATSSLEEELFAFIATGLRRLKPHRAYLGPLVQTALSPLVSSARSDDLNTLREQQLRQVHNVLDKHG